MIREHEFNSNWWGESVGIVTNPEFFSLPSDDQKAELEKYNWVEFKCSSKECNPILFAQSGFVAVDVQNPFKIALSKISDGPSMAKLKVISAEEDSFILNSDDIAPFVHERFYYLQGVNADRVSDRYVKWSNTMINENPVSCLRIEFDGETQGWFLSKLNGKSIELDLAMLHKNAIISGMYLYQKSLLAYANLGARMGSASFSVTNSAVHNIYAQLNARFTDPLWCWMWSKNWKS